ncbi:MAG: DUF4190 domain-containing protein [Oscillospiraceae bacterium]|nr:DUF4190 domain-containing protein [Oscillospiraceae bacterium]
MTVKNMSITALVCGIVGIVGSFIPYVSWVAPLAAIAGIVFGALALKRIKAGEEVESKGLALGGMICGIVSTAVSVLIWACAICVVCAAAGAIGSLGGALGALFIL